MPSIRPVESTVDASDGCPSGGSENNCNTRRSLRRDENIGPFLTDIKAVVVTADEIFSAILQDGHHPIRVMEACCAFFQSTNIS